MPGEPVYPGVYIEEIASGARRISGVETCATGFAGFVLKHPIKEAVHVFSFSDFERNFGDLGPETQVASAIEQYFLHGGTDAWVVRTVPPSATTSCIAVLLHAELG